MKKQSKEDQYKKALGMIQFLITDNQWRHEASNGSLPDWIDESLSAIETALK